ncbi:MerR family transcriptional regulator [Emergencia timonensis]|uniref:MerR family transcriptional regulator n=1 Tax=Emergencia timonensis TaxID=1776384 RepID=UPI003995D2B9
MRTTSQVAKLTGISVRTLQYYDEINLLNPSQLTSSGYRLYDDEDLKKLQQILFFKELDFKLKEIKAIIGQPDYCQIEVYKKQKKLLSLKRDRLNRLISLLDKLEKGESRMSFTEFDLSEYIDALEQFKTSEPDQIIKYWGSVESFDKLIEKVKEDEPHLAQLAVKQFGSVEKYTEAMKNNLAHFSELMEQADGMRESIDTLMKKNDDLHVCLTADMDREVSSPEVQRALQEIIELSQDSLMGMAVGDGYWNMVIESYENEINKAITDQKYGEGASDYIADALRYYFHK